MTSSSTSSSSSSVLYLQDILNECSVPEKFSQAKQPASDTSDTLIVDFGNWQCRVGWSNEPEPSMVFDSMVHRWKDDNGVAMVKIGRNIPAGSNIRATSRSAFENGLAVHTPTIELIFDFILKQMIGKQGISLIMTETPLIPPYCRQEVMELLFEGYSCIDRVAFVLDGPAALPDSIPTALSIHIGAVNTHIYPIIEGAIDWSQVKRINWGGMVAADFLLKIMGLKYPGILNSTNPNKLTPFQTQAIWQKTAIVAEDVANYESEMDALSRANGSTLATLNCCIRLTGDAATEADRRKAVAEAKKAAELNQVALQEKRKILADKLRQKAEEQRVAKLRSKEHIYQALQGLIERVQTTLKKSKKIVALKKVNEDEDISMEFSDNEEEELDADADVDEDLENVNFSLQNLGDAKLFEELKRLGFKSVSNLQEGLRRAEEDYFRLSGQSDLIVHTVTDFSMLAIPDSELSESEIREKRRLRLIKSSADARERQKAEKAAEDAKKQAAAEILEMKRLRDLEGWRADIYGKRREIIDKLVRRQKQRADRKGAAQGSRFRSVVALGESTEEPANNANTNNPSGPSDSGPDDGFGLNDDDWLVYRQVSRDDEEDSDLQDQELLSQLEGLLEEKDHEEFMKRLQEEQFASLTLLDRLTFGGDPEAEIEASAGQPTININAERMRCTEGLFQPLSIQGIDQAGLIEILSNILSAYPKHHQLALSKNIHVSGGPAALPGLETRLINEISSILPEDCVSELEIHVSTDLEAAWKGIQRRAAISDGGFNWITRDEYFENKPVEETIIDAIEIKNKNKKKKQPIVNKIQQQQQQQNQSSLQNNLNNKNCSNPY